MREFLRGWRRKIYTIGIPRDETLYPRQIRVESGGLTFTPHWFIAGIDRTAQPPSWLALEVVHDNLFEELCVLLLQLIVLRVVRILRQSFESI